MDLFGKKALKTRIKELEEKIEELQKYRKRWEKEKKRYKEAVTEKQEADKKINRMEDRIATLKDRLESGEKKDLESFDREKIGVSRAYRYLKQLSKLETGRNTLTSYKPPEKGFLNSGMSEMFLHEPLTIKSVFMTPLMLKEKEFVSDRFVTEHFLEKLDSRTLFIHFSAGGSGIGIFENRKPYEISVIRSDIKSKHKKGGYSQKRFERLREQQIESHREKVEKKLDQYLKKGFEQVVITGSDGRKGLKDKIDGFVAEVRTRQGNIIEKNDIVDSFESGMGVYHVRLGNEMAEDMISRILE